MPWCGDTCGVCGAQGHAWGTSAGVTSSSPRPSIPVGVLSRERGCGRHWGMALDGHGGDGVTWGAGTRVGHIWVGTGVQRYRWDTSGVALGACGHVQDPKAIGAARGHAWGVSGGHLGHRDRSRAHGEPPHPNTPQTLRDPSPVPPGILTPPVTPPEPPTAPGPSPRPPRAPARPPVLPDPCVAAPVSPGPPKFPKAPLGPPPLSPHGGSRRPRGPAPVTMGTRPRPRCHGDDAPPSFDHAPFAGRVPGPCARPEIAAAPRKVPSNRLYWQFASFPSLPGCPAHGSAATRTPRPVPSLGTAVSLTGAFQHHCPQRCGGCSCATAAGRTGQDPVGSP